MEIYRQPNIPYSKVSEEEYFGQLEYRRRPADLVPGFCDDETFRFIFEQEDIFAIDIPIKIEAVKYTNGLYLIQTTVPDRRGTINIFNFALDENGHYYQLLDDGRFIPDRGYIVGGTESIDFKVALETGLPIEVA